MSHKASNWLAELPASAMSGGEFRVMFHLCDAHNSKRDPHTACFPQQEALRKATGLSNGGLNRALNRLEEAGFILRVRGTEPDSHVRRTYYILGCDLDDAQEQTPLSGVRANSTLEGGQTPLSGGANSTPVELHIKDEPVRTSKGTSKGAKSILCSVLSEKTSDDFIAHRKAMRKPLTERAAELIVGKLRQCRDPDGVVNMSIMNGWQGVFPEREKTGAKDGDAADRAQRAAERYATRRLDRGQDRNPSQPLLPAGQPR